MAECYKCELWKTAQEECALHDLPDETFFKYCPNAPKNADDWKAFDENIFMLADADEEK